MALIHFGTISRDINLQCAREAIEHSLVWVRVRVLMDPNVSASASASACACASARRSQGRLCDDFH